MIVHRPQMPNVTGKPVSGSSVESVSMFPITSTMDEKWLHVYFVRAQQDSLNTFLETCTVPWLLSPRRDTLYTTEKIDLDEFPPNLVTVGPLTKASLIPVDMWVFMAALKARSINQVRLPFRERQDVIDVIGGGRLDVFSSFLGWRVSVCGSPATGRNPDSSRSLLESYEDFAESQMDPLSAFNDHITNQPGHVLKVLCLHQKNGRAKIYEVSRLSKTPASTQTFSLNKTTITVDEYFKSRGIHLSHPDLPLLVDVRGRFLPLELCRTVETDEQIDYTRLGEFFALLNPFGLHVNFDSQITVSAKLTKINPLGLPDRSKEMSSCKAWLVRVGESNDDDLVNLVECLKSKGLEISFSNTIEIKNLDEWEQDLKKGLNQEAAGPCDILVVLSSGYLPRDVYRGMKKIFDIKLGIPSQMLRLERLRELKDNGAYARDLVNQIVVKVSGAQRPSRAPGQRKSAVAQVTTALVGIWHETVPGVPGVILRGYSMSVDLTIPHNRYVHQVCVSPMKVNEPDDKSVYELLMNFFEINGHFPTRIIVYERARSVTRMFTQVSSDVNAWSSAINRINRELRTGINTKLQEYTKDQFNPNLTLVHCERVIGMTAGAIYDDRSLVGNNGMNFYIQSHGTSFATHYRSVHDQNRFTLTELENYTFDMCLGTRGYPVCLLNSKKLVERFKLYIEADLDTIHGMQKDPMVICDYLNQCFTSEFAAYNRLIDAGRSAFV